MCDHCSNQGIENAEKIADTAAAPDEMPKTYDPSSVEERLYKNGKSADIFIPSRIPINHLTPL